MQSRCRGVGPQQRRSQAEPMVSQRHLVCTWKNTWTPKICHIDPWDVWDGHFLVGWGISSLCGKITQPLVLWTWMYQLSSWSLGWINSKRFFSGWNHSIVLNVNANAKKAEYWYIFQELHGHWATSLCPKILKFFYKWMYPWSVPPELWVKWTQLGEWNKGREGVWRQRCTEI